ncbi:putative F-box domain, galactose oxidase/kelch, beta-propeller, F-box associated interaction [Helianthus debilis subsp. tardiflorus]
MPRLPTDVIISDILTRVPAKTAARSKSVCKEWRALLSTRDFEKAHCSRTLTPSNQRTLLIRDLSCHIQPMEFETADYGLQTIVPLPFQAEIKDVMILSHLDGLLCVCLQHTDKLVLWNPTTGAHTLLATPAGHGLYTDLTDTVGLYNGAGNDYRVLHLSRRSDLVSAHVYSRQLGSWRKIAFGSNPEYQKPRFYWSPGTVCGGTLYFTVCECYVVGKNLVVGFDTNTEQVTEISFPPVPSSGIFQGILVDVRQSLHMVLWTGHQDMSLTLWALQGETWVKHFSTPTVPPIPLSLWLTITHYLTDGTFVVMSNSRKLYEIRVGNNPLECYYASSWFRGYIGAVFQQTLVSPNA